MKLTIEKANNGFIIEYPEYMFTEKDERVELRKELFEIENCFGETDYSKVVEMLYWVLDHFGMLGSKHNKERIQIRVAHGDSYECNVPDCKLCENDD